VVLVFKNKFWCFLNSYIFILLSLSTLKNNPKIFAERHPYHLVDPSPWPIFTSVALLNNIFYVVGYLHEIMRIGCPFIQPLHFYSIFGLFFIIGSWFNDIVLESTFEGRHTRRVQNGLYLGIALFIISEIFFFFGFFWAFFHSSISPSIFIGNVWPPLGVETLSTWLLPFLNTVILISSGISVTWAHRAIVIAFFTQTKKKIKISNFSTTLVAIFITIFYGLLFTYIQRFEYINAGFSFDDGIYGTVFFFNYRFTRFTCFSRNDFFNRLYIPYCVLSFYKIPSRGF
jgi:cytochrome c oxidase subunit 3